VNATWSTFVPGLIVLAIGLAVGVFLAVRLRRGQQPAIAVTARAGKSGARVAPVAAVDQRDLDLERADLEARRDEIYARLRDHEGDELSPAERRDFELQAARTLRRLEEIEASAGGPRRAPASAAAAQAAPPATARPHAGVIGFAYGAMFAALVAVLLYWVARDAQPRAEPSAAPMQARGDGAMAGAPAGGGGGAGGADDAHSRLQQLSPEARQRVTSIQAHLEQNPDDLDARKALAETYVTEGLFFEAFEESQNILKRKPGDVDGLYFEGLIRLTMGQDDTAIELLDQALTTEPAFVSARLVRGLAKLRIGNREAAIADWRAGLDAAGGKHQGLERLLQMAEAGATAEEILGSPPPGHPGAGEAGGERTARMPAGGPASALAGSGRATSADAASGGGAYRVHVELAPGKPAPSGAVLFVNLRVVAGAGPPAAVKRIDSPKFPLDFTLDSSDAMVALGGGGPFPESGTVSVRLDADGNASTRDPSEPSAQAEVKIEQPVTLVLK
jgi:hypothetical protein